MKCIIPGINIKTFARAIHSLARVGDELYVEPTVSGVFFRTVNSSRSAFGSFFFKSDFFSLYDFKVPEIHHENFKCKIAMKACLNAFKSLNTVERSVEKCRMIVDPENDRLVVDMTCRHGIHKTYNLTFIECEALQLVIDKTKCQFGTSSHSRLLCDAFMNFQSNQEEVTLAVSPQKMHIRNYVDDDPDPAKAIHTELTIESLEFDSYDIKENAEVTFCLKEVRALLSFSEPANLPVSFVFDAPGCPIIFTAENAAVFEANFVLATLYSTMDVTQPRRAIDSQQASKQSTSTRAPGKRAAQSNGDSSTRNHLRRSSEDIGDFSARINSNQIDASAASPSKPMVKPPPEWTRNSAMKPPASRNSPAPRHESESGETGGNQKRKVVEEDEDEDVIPGTPPPKRKRAFFRRCFEPTFYANNLSAFRRIITEDSDDET